MTVPLVLMVRLFFNWPVPVWDHVPVPPKRIVEVPDVLLVPALNVRLPFKRSVLLLIVMAALAPVPSVNAPVTSALSAKVIVLVTLN